jgi:tRNA-specific 2-thiouridylase
MNYSKDSSPRNRILMAMSGGVDSSVAAAKLVEDGYDVIGVMLGLWSDTTTENLCCTQDARVMAEQISKSLAIPFHYIDVENKFHNDVVQYFVNSYMNGETPNPCVICNRQFRWHELMEVADDFGATSIATGHFARVKKNNFGVVDLLKGIDHTKDQSYVLHGLTQAELIRTYFPLGKLTKKEVRKYASDHSLPVADRPDSQDLCFVGDEGYKDFLMRNAPEVLDPGPIITRNNEKIGEHKGLAFYTIGQRKGLGISGPRPYYVVEKVMNDNMLIVGELEELGGDELEAVHVNWISGIALKNQFRASVKVRYRSKEVFGIITPIKGNRIHIKFETPIRDITPGQFAVIYDGDICLGGGKIL